MSEKRFTLNMIKKPSEIEMDGKMISKYDVVRLLNEQQATIRKLQDLCGESDGENAKLRIENKKLKEMNEQLKEELNNLKKDETMLYHYYTLARYGGDGV